MKFSSPEWGAGGWRSVRGGWRDSPLSSWLHHAWELCSNEGMLCALWREGDRGGGGGRRVHHQQDGIQKKKKKKITHREQHHLRRGNAGLPPLHLPCGFGEHTSCTLLFHEKRFQEGNPEVSPRCVLSQERNKRRERRRRRKGRKGRLNLSLCGCGGGRDVFCCFFWELKATMDCVSNGKSLREPCSTLMRDCSVSQRVSC